MNRGRDPRMYVRDIIESCDLIIANTRNLDIATFRKDVTVQDAVMRRFEIIGEAVKRLPQTLVEKYPNVPWKDAAGFRDVLAHDYPEIVIDEVFFTAREQVPVFLVQIREVFDDMSKES